MQFLRSNTAVIVSVGPFYDKTDGVTIKTALTITNERITLTADTDAGSDPTNILDNVTGATTATANDLKYITGNDAGMMQLELAAADVNRVGRMRLSITDAANHCPVIHDYFVLPAAIFDWFTGVIVPLPANVTTFGGTAGTFAAGIPEVKTASLANDSITAAVIANNAIDNATFAADVGTTAIATNVIGIAAKKGVVDALNVDTYAEPGQEAPAATNTLIKKIGYLFKLSRNKVTQTATTLSVFADDTTTVDQKSTVSDDATTYTRGEIGSGP